MGIVVNNKETKHIHSKIIEIKIIKTNQVDLQKIFLVVFYLIF